MRWVYTDGGRQEAGFEGDARDCVCRAIAVASQRPYRQVYDELAAANKAAGGTRSARNGIPKKVIRKYLSDMGWTWTPTMKIGQGCKVHLTPEELPAGRIICSVSRHLCAVIDGVLHDSHDCSRGGNRCVYGYWTQDDSPALAEVMS